MGVFAAVLYYGLFLFSLMIVVYNFYFLLKTLFYYLNNIDKRKTFFSFHETWIQKESTIFKKDGSVFYSKVSHLVRFSAPEAVFSLHVLDKTDASSFLQFGIILKNLKGEGKSFSVFFDFFNKKKYNPHCVSSWDLFKIQKICKELADYYSVPYTEKGVWENEYKALRKINI
jgi:hypothetical protein